MSQHLFIFTFSPVQQFILEARRAQDLFAGSKVLSDLSKAALVALLRGEAEAIYPPANHEADANKLEDIPNKMTLVLPDKLTPNKAGDLASAALIQYWRDLCKHTEEVARTWGDKITDKPDKVWDEIWNRQIGGIWECYWAAVPLAGMAYSDAYRQVNRLLDAAKRPRAFAHAQEDGIKDTLSGSRSALRVRSKDSKAYWSSVFANTTKNERFNAAKLRPNGRELLDALGCVKRFGLTTAEMPTIPSTSSVASEDFLQSLMKAQKTDSLKVYAQTVEKILGEAVFPVRKQADRPGGWAFDGDLLYSETLTVNRLMQEYGLLMDCVALRDVQTALKALYRAAGERPRNYLAVLVMDGDAMGERVDRCANETEHRDFSKALSSFASDVKTIVQRHYGSKVYAGGDDVLALLPLSTVLVCAAELAELFRTKVVGCNVSAGIAIGHHTQPLDGLLAEGRRAEQIAKNVPGKGAVAIVANKRSGERVEAVAKWSRISTVLRFVEAFEPGLKADGEPSDRSLISPRFAHDMRGIAASFMPVVGREGTSAIRAAGYLSQLRQQLSQHMDKQLSQVPGFNLAIYHRPLADWLGAQIAPATNNTLTQPADETDPETVANWLIVARFVAQRSDGGDE